MTLNDFPLVITDIETTGGRYHNHRIIEIGMIKVVNGKKVDEYQSLIDPQCEIPESITRLTGITNEMVSKAPTFRSLHEPIYEFLNGSVFVAHNASFDYGFIKQEFERLSIKYSAKILCSLRLSRKLFPRFKRHDVSTLMQRYGIKVANRHRALDDAKVVWGFLQMVQKKVPRDQQITAIKEITRKPSIPPHLNIDVEDIPEMPGVYFLLDKTDKPLYIGKAKNLRSRILSHFSEKLRPETQVDFSGDIAGIKMVETQGELAAHLLEAHYIKTQFPPHNRRSRRVSSLTVLKWDDAGPYHKLSYQGYDVIHKEDLADAVAIFHTRRDAQRYLEQIAKDKHLCKTLLGLETPHQGKPCAGYKTKQCRGACIEEEQPVKYNVRLKEALAGHPRFSWPYEGMLMIEEHNHEKSKGEVIVIDRWIIREAFRYDGEQKENLFQLQPQFDLDVYKIVHGYLKRRKDLNIKIIRHPVAEPAVG